MSKCLDPFRFLLISLAGWMNQQWPISTRPIKPRSHDRSHAGISHDRSHAGVSHERLARRRYAPCTRLWRLLCDPRSFHDTRRLANPEVSDGDVTLGWPWDAADRVFGPYAISGDSKNRTDRFHCPNPYRTPLPARHWVTRPLALTPTAP